MSDRLPTSSWQRQQKSAYLYSPTYQLWREAVAVHGFMSQKAVDLACKHAKQMNVRRNLPDGTHSEECYG